MSSSNLDIHSNSRLINGSMDWSFRRNPGIVSDTHTHTHTHTPIVDRHLTTSTKPVACTVEQRWAQRRGEVLAIGSHASSTSGLMSRNRRLRDQGSAEIVSRLIVAPSRPTSWNFASGWPRCRLSRMFCCRAAWFADHPGLSALATSKTSRSSGSCAVRSPNN